MYGCDVQVIGGVSLSVGDVKVKQYRKMLAVLHLPKGLRDRKSDDCEGIMIGLHLLILSVMACVACQILRVLTPVLLGMAAVSLTPNTTVGSRGSVSRRLMLSLHLYPLALLPSSLSRRAKEKEAMLEFNCPKEVGQQSNIVVLSANLS